MGLDMYLTAKRHASSFTDKRLYTALLEASGLKDAVDPNPDAFPSVSISVQIGYWRKANAIHKWFVDNTQDGRDECQLSWVSREQLIALRDLCQKALRTKDPSLLPAQSGFFFGPTDVDDYYWQDIQDTIAILDRGLALEDVDFEYQASW